MSSIPASFFVDVIPGVIAAGGTQLSLTGLMLTTSTRPPIGTVQSFPNAAGVAAYFGAASAEYAEAQVYFNGFDNSTTKPAALLFAQYPWAAPVGAYLRGGSMAAVSLATLQAVSGTVIVTVDGTQYTSSSFNLSAATSFSNAASLIQTALGATEAVVTGAIAVGAASVTASIATTTMTVTAIGSGTLFAGQTISGSGVSTGTTIVSQLTGTAGGTGTYQVSISQTASSTAIAATSTSGVLTVSAVSSGTLAIGQVISGTGVTAGTYITAKLTGTGGTGTYVVSASQTASSTAITAGTVGVTFDSTASAFVIAAGSNGATSTIGFATGTAAAALFLQAAQGAVTSQGAAMATPNAFMTALVGVSQSWATFMTMFEPVTADKVAFASWNNAQGNRFGYAMWSTDITLTSTNDSSTAVAQIIAAGYSGTLPIYEPSNLHLSAFALGAVASINWLATNGRATLAYKSQSGIAPSVFDATSAANLIANGCNFYGNAAGATEQWNFFYPGSITGPFQWADSYFGQIVLNTNLQTALMTLLTSVNSIPYNAQAYGLIEAACAGPINAALNAGIIATGIPLSPLQAAEVNAAAGKVIDGIISTRGWYLLIQPASATTRAARQSPPITLWYADGQSVQNIQLASIDVQ